MYRYTALIALCLLMAGCAATTGPSTVTVGGVDFSVGLEMRLAEESGAVVYNLSSDVNLSTFLRLKLSMPAPPFPLSVLLLDAGGVTPLYVRNEYPGGHGGGGPEFVQLHFTQAKVGQLAVVWSNLSGPATIEARWPAGTTSTFIHEGPAEARAWAGSTGSRAVGTPAGEITLDDRFSAGAPGTKILMIVKTSGTMASHGNLTIRDAGGDRGIPLAPVAPAMRHVLTTEGRTEVSLTAASDHFLQIHVTFAEIPAMLLPYEFWESWQEVG